MFFVDFGVCPEGLRRVPVDMGAQVLLFQPDKAKNKNKMGAKMERFGFPNPNYSNFGTPILEAWGCQKWSTMLEPF